MSKYSTVETDKAVIRVYLVDGTMKSFLVTQSQTPNAVKFLVCKKLGLDVKEFNQFGLYILENDTSVADVAETPFLLHVKWGTKVNNRFKFLFKRQDQSYPPPRSDTPSPTNSSSQLPRQSQAVSFTTTAEYGSPPESARDYSYSNANQGGNGYDGNNDNNNMNGGYEEYRNETSPPESSMVRGSGYGYNVTSQQVDRASKSLKKTPQRTEMSKAALISWVNTCVADYGLSVQNLGTDMSDGIVFFRLLEVVTRKTLKGWHTEPSNMMLKLDNLTMFLRILGYFGIKISGVSSEDIYSGNENIITAILLLLIKKYTPPAEDPNAAQYNTTPTPRDSQMNNGGNPPSTEYNSGAVAHQSNHEDLEEAPPQEEAPLPPPDAVMKRLSSMNSPVPDGARARARSKMVSSQDRAAAGLPEFSPSGTPFNGSPMITHAPPKLAIDPSLTPDLSLLTGLGVGAMPLQNLDMNAHIHPFLQPTTSQSGGFAASSLPQQQQQAAHLQQQQTSSSPVGPKKFNLPPGPSKRLSQAPFGQVNTATVPPKMGTAASPKVAPGPSKMSTAGTPKMASPGQQHAGLPKQAPAKVPLQGVPKMGSTGQLAGIPKQAPAKVPLQGSPKQALAKAPSPRPFVARPLPSPAPKDMPREEVDIAIVPQNATQNSSPSLEIDFSAPVPGSEASTAANGRCHRASTISNINTNVFDLDAFSDMESLLLGLADGM